MIKKNKAILFLSIFIMVFLFSTNVFAQVTGSLENRVRALENYVDTFEPTLSEFSNEFQKSLRQYSQGLEVSLQKYTQGLEKRLEERLSRIENKSIYLDPKKGSYQRVVTKSGDFLVAVKGVDTINNGIKLSLDIGNPNYADYKNFTLKLVWGNKPPKNATSDAVQVWRNSLMGAEYAFQGTLEKGMWNDVELNLIPASRNEFGYLEIEMEVSSAEFQYKKY